MTDFFSQDTQAQEEPRTTSGALTRPALLIFNRSAGGSSSTTPETLCAALEQIGYVPKLCVTHSEEELSAALSGLQGTVFVAGGDGTIRSVALHLAGKRDVVLGVIPMGTANNIGRMLGVQEGSPLNVISSYLTAQVRPFDLGRVTAPWGEDLFLEACGCGAFAETLAEYNPEDGKSPLRAVQALGTTINEFEARPLTITINHEEVSERSYALLEIMNTKATGPRLRLASSADPHDGLLDVICIDDQECDSVISYVAALARDDFETLPSVQAYKAGVITIPYEGQAFHVDGEVRSGEQGQQGQVKIEVWPGALQVLTAQLPTEASQ